MMVPNVCVCVMSLSKCVCVYVCDSKRALVGCAFRMFVLVGEVHVEVSAL